MVEKPSPGIKMEEQTYNVGPMMKAARKFKKLNQAEVAKAIGCSQSALSKMEHNLLVPSAPQWFLFSRFTAIPPENLESGFIDRHRKVKFNTTDVSMGFKIPKPYRQFRAQKVRETYPFFRYLELKDGPQLFKEFINSTGLDSEFFVDFDNLVNFNLMLELMRFMVRAGKNTSESIREIAELGQNPIYWDHFDKDWRRLKTVPELYECFAKEQLFFQADFQLKVEISGNEISVTYLPEFHLKNKEFPEDLMRFLNAYRKYSLNHLVKKIFDKEMNFELVGLAGLGAKFSSRF